jgi:hypothetical protein
MELFDISLKYNGNFAMFYFFLLITCIHSQQATILAGFQNIFEPDFGCVDSCGTPDDCHSTILDMLSHSKYCSHTTFVAMPALYNDLLCASASDIPTQMIVFGLTDNGKFVNGTINTCLSFRDCMSWACQIKDNPKITGIMFTGK